MSRETTTIASADGTRLNLSHWAAEGPPVLLVHGLAEHMGRYDHVAAALNQGGFDVWGLELRGHGHSAGQRGHVGRWTDYGDDVHAALAHIDAPAFVVAHSMGGLVLTSVLLDRPDGIRAAVLSNPLFGTSFEPPKIKVAAGKVLTHIWPTLSLPNELDTSHISRDQSEVDKYVADKLVYSVITPRWGTEMMDAQADVLSRPGDLKTPTLLLSGSDDKICSSPKAQEWAGKAGADIKVYDGYYHELFNEPPAERAVVLADLVAWLKGQADA